MAKNAKPAKAKSEGVDHADAVAAEGNNEGVKVEANREKYTRTRAASGAKSLHNGDPVAVALNGCAIDSLYGTVSEFLDIPEKELREKYGHLNVGMQRMNLGNKIRGAVNQINKANEKQEKPGPSGEDRFEKIARPLVKETEARIKEEEKEKAAKAKKAEAKAKTAEKAEKGKAKAA